MALRNASSTHSSINPGGRFAATILATLRPTSSRECFDAILMLPRMSVELHDAALRGEVEGFAEVLVGLEPRRPIRAVAGGTLGVLVEVRGQLGRDRRTDGALVIREIDQLVERRGPGDVLRALPHIVRRHSDERGQRLAPLAVSAARSALEAVDGAAGDVDAVG